MLVVSANIYVDDMEHRTQSTPIQKRLLRVKTAAEVLDVSRAYAYRLVQEGHIPSVRIGKSLRVPIDGLEEYLAGLREAR